MGLTKRAKPAAPRARLTYLPETSLAAYGATPVPIRTETESLPARVKRYFSALDHLDADMAASFFAAGATLRLPGLAPIVGRPAIRRALVEFSLDVDELRHAPVQLWTARNLAVFEADMTLTFVGRTSLAFPVTHIIRWVDGFIDDVRVNVYLESRMAVALSAFERLRNHGCALRRPA